MPRQPHTSDRLPRGVCPVCGRDVTLRRGGQLREHRPDGPLCAGSGLTIAEVEASIDRELEALRRMGR